MSREYQQSRAAFQKRWLATWKAVFPGVSYRELLERSRGHTFDLWAAVRSFAERGEMDDD